MCDTIYFKRNGRSYFGKNSDRSPNEAHLMIREPAKDYQSGEMLKTTYITIQQIAHTYECVLLKPNWIWGAEMGWNEWGLNIGNEALFSLVKRGQYEGLIGMDLIRLALERCKTAKEALQLIIESIKVYGQVGNCGYDKKFYYDNAFMIADKNDGFLLETAGRNWAYRKVYESATISNCYSLSKNYDYCARGFSGDFKKRFQNNLFTRVAGAEKRKAMTASIIVQDGEPFSLLLEALQSHENEKISINKSSTSSVCMHAGNLFGDQTTGSYFGEIGKLYFVSGSSFPCMSVFKPVTQKANILPTDEKVALDYWLKREILHRHIMCGNIDQIKFLIAVQSLQDKIFKMVANAKTDAELEKVSKDSFDLEQKLVDNFLELGKGNPLHLKKGGMYFKSYWNKKNKELLDAYKI